jgi:hypothetical protein
VLVVYETVSGLPADPTDATMIAHNLGTSKSKAGAHANVGDTIGVIIVMP